MYIGFNVYFGCLITTIYIVMRIMSVGIFITIMIFLLTKISALDNGLALKPPMGWMTWQRFRCTTDCNKYPDECISEGLIKTTADLLVSEGYADVGYEYVIIDDCWLSKERSEEGKLQADPERFPNGIKALADYVHSKGLKFGIYEDFGNFTCAGYPGVLGHLETDANTFAEWEVDYVKLDGCYSKIKDMEAGYAEFGKYLNQTGRPMVYSCSWPAYMESSGIDPNFTALQETCNLWRNYGDIQDSWHSVVDIMNFFGKDKSNMSTYAGPGHWNDPDMLIIGNYGLSLEQSKAQMAVWSILAAPLLLSTKIDDVSPEFKKILQNKEIILVNQDPLGIQGRLVYKKNKIAIWTKQQSPISGDDYSYAVAFVSSRTDGMPYHVTVTLESIGLTSTTGYSFQDLYSGKSFKLNSSKSKISVRVNPSGVVFLRANVVT